MTTMLVPTSKIGTPFQSPSWRYQVVYFPERFGFGKLRSRNEVNAGYLTRLISKGLTPAASYNLPIYFRELLTELPNHLAEQLIKTWDKYYFREHNRKLGFNSNVTRNVPISWNVKKVKMLNDVFLKRLILHCFDYQYDQYIDEAIRFYKDEANDVNRKWFNYCFYGKHSDEKIAKKWKKSVRFVEALRLTFFDYSHWPDDKYVQFSLIRQLVANKELDEQDFHVFRRIYDLGELGLRSVVSVNDLSNAEMKEVEMYLSSSSVDKLLNLCYSVTDTKSALNYTKAAAEYAHIGLKRKEIEQKTELLRLTSNKLAKDMGEYEETTSWPEETQLLELMREMSHRDYKPEFPSFIDIKAQEANLVVETKSQS